MPSAIDRRRIGPHQRETITRVSRWLANGAPHAEGADIRAAVAEVYFALKLPQPDAHSVRPFALDAARLWRAHGEAAADAIANLARDLARQAEKE